MAEHPNSILAHRATGSGSRRIVPVAEFCRKFPAVVPDDVILLGRLGKIHLFECRGDLWVEPKNARSRIERLIKRVGLTMAPGVGRALCVVLTSPRASQRKGRS